MAETIAVLLIVAAVLVLAGRSLYRTFTGKDVGCGCRGDCPLSSSCHEPNKDSGTKN